MKLEKVQTQRIYQKISELIKEHIRNGEFKPGEMLPSERDLSKQLGVSRSSVREAFIALEVTQWIEIRPGNGVYVLQQTPEINELNQKDKDDFSIRSLMLARKKFEGMMAELAAENATDEQIAQLRQIAKVLVNKKQNNAEFLDEDRKFHLLISEMSGNEVLKDMMEYLWNKRHNSRFQSMEEHYVRCDFPLFLQKEHEDITVAIYNRDPKQAKEVMEIHLEHVLQVLLGNRE